MSGEEKKVKSIVLLEGHVRWIMERETPEERLAAWETLAAIAFPENPYELPYKPPKLPLDGSRLSPCDRVRRDAYNMLADYINSRQWEQTDGKNPRKVAAGRLGAAIKHGKYGSSAASTTDYETNESSVRPTEFVQQDQPPAPQEPQITMTPMDVRAEETVGFSESYLKIEPKLTAKDKKQIAEWHKKIPNAAALREWLDRNWFYQNKKMVCSEQFCEYAYNRIAREYNWVSPKTSHALGSILSTIHYFALDFTRKSHEIKRTEEEERRKDIESDFDTKTMVASHKSSEDVADMQRISSRKAEREAMEKILRGEL